MGQSIFVPPYSVPGTSRHLRRFARISLAAALVALVASLGLAVVSSIPEAIAAASGLLAAETPAAAPYPDAAARELPREWRTWKTGVDVDAMYRNPPSQRLDWIREGGRR